MNPINSNSQGLHTSESLEDGVIKITSLPDELLVHIFSFLSPISASRLNTVCKKFRKLSTDSLIWEAVGKRHFPSFEKGEGPAHLRVMFLIGYHIAGPISREYPSALLKHTSTAHIADLPVRDIDRKDKEQDYERYHFRSDDPPVVRGKLLPSNRPFIAVRYVDESTSEIHEDTFFQRTTIKGDESNWAVSTGSVSHVHSTGGMSKSDFEYLGRLIMGKPCGLRARRADEGEKLLQDGTSVVHLYSPKKAKPAS